MKNWGEFGGVVTLKSKWCKAIKHGSWYSGHEEHWELQNVFGHGYCKSDTHNKNRGFFLCVIDPPEIE